MPAEHRIESGASGSRRMGLGLIVAHEPAASPYAGMSWATYQDIADRVVGRFEGHYRLRCYDYLHPTSLQPRTPERLRKPYRVKVSYLEWGDPGKPLIVCCGGVANVAHRFNYLALALKADYHVVCVDWVGRGESGWMHDQGDYSLATYVEQIRQLISHLGNLPFIMLGSSMGGSVAIELSAASSGRLLTRLILNDTGPHIQAARRVHRGDTLARHYVFRSPAEMFRKIGASQKNDGPVSDDVRLSGSYTQTKWSEPDGGRIYRHDVRALQEYRASAGRSVRQWDKWEELDRPVLVIHGTESDVLLRQTLRRMQKKASVTVMHVPLTGHTPTLSDPNHIWCMREWLREDSPITREFSSFYSPPSPLSEKRTGARPII
jgi:pimeloyl-ACP methyl ester carboxylesterase